MPQISKDALTEFQRLYERRFGVALSNADALAKATQLLSLVRATMPRHTTSGSDQP